MAYRQDRHSQTSQAYLDTLLLWQPCTVFTIMQAQLSRKLVMSVVSECGNGTYLRILTMQIVAWAEKLAVQPGKVQHQQDKDTQWRKKAAEAVVMHCLHDLKVCLC